MKPKIAYAIHNYLGLTETFIYSYLIHIKTFTPLVITASAVNQEHFPFHAVYDASQIPRYSWWWFRDRAAYYYSLDKKDYFEHILYFTHILKKEKVRLIHAHFGPEGAAMVPIKRWLNLPLITTFYGYDVSQLPRETLWKHTYQRLFQEGDLFLVEGGNMMRSLIEIGCPVEKIVIQHIGVNTEKIHYNARTPPDGKVILLFCGRFVEKKGLIYSLQALRRLLSRYPDIELRIIGDGILRRDIESFIQENNLGHHVRLLGYQPHHVFVEELKKAHIYLQPSVTAQNGDSEGGAPTTLLEAQASGIPVVSSYHADIPEVVIHGKSGLLAPERNSDVLADHVSYLIDHPEEWPIMGREGRRHVEANYNISREVKNLEAIYSSLISKNTQ